MANGRRRLTVLAMALIVAAPLAATAMEGEVPLLFKGDGKVSSWGFSFNHEVKVSSETLLKGGEDALKAIFKGAEVKGDKAKIEEASGELTIGKDGAITGKVKLSWTVSGNPKTLDAGLSGTATLSEDGKTVVKLSLKSEKGKVAGSWKHAGGAEMKTSGTGSFTVETAGAKEEKKEEPKKEEPKKEESK